MRRKRRTETQAPSHETDARRGKALCAGVWNPRAPDLGPPGGSRGAGRENTDLCT